MMELLLPIVTLKSLLPLFAVIAGIFVISTKNAIISVFNLIVLYILVAFYLIYIGMTYLGISYIIIYIGAIAILFLFIIMMIDIEVVEKRNNNYLPLLFLLLCGFFFSLKKILYNIGLIKMKSVTFKEELVLTDNGYGKLFNTDYFNNFDKEDNQDKIIQDKNNDIFFQDLSNLSSNNFGDKLYYLSKEEYIPLFYEDLSINTLSNDKWIKELMKSNNNKEINENNIFVKNEYNNIMNNNNNNVFNKSTFIDSSSLLNSNEINNNINYLLVTPNWNSALNKITQVTAVGDVLYTVYHSYIYIISVILLLGMVGAIILTADSYQEIRIINISKNRKSSVFFLYYIINIWNSCIFYYKNIIKKEKNIFYIIFFTYLENTMNILKFIFKNFKLFKNKFNYNVMSNKSAAIPFFFHTLNSDPLHSEGIIGNLTYFIVANLIIALLLLSINYYFSLSVKYLEKGGGFECGFTSFVQTRERFNIIFYRVSLLFLVFDLEIILAFPYTAIYQKNQNIGKNNVLIFLYILIVGFIYELKEGALNIVKKAHSNEININYI